MRGTSLRLWLVFRTRASSAIACNSYYGLSERLQFQNATSTPRRCHQFCPPFSESVLECILALCQYTYAPFPHCLTDIGPSRSISQEILAKIVRESSAANSMFAVKVSSTWSPFSRKYKRLRYLLVNLEETGRRPTFRMIVKVPSLLA